MFNSLLKLLFWVVVIVLIYNYFWGSSSEKESSRKIFGEVKTLAVSVKDLISSEKEKFDAGKYDKAIGKLDEILDKLKTEAQSDNGLLQQIKDLEGRKDEIQQDLKKVNPKQKQSETEIKTEFNDLLKDTEKLLQEMEK